MLAAVLGACGADEATGAAEGDVRPYADAGSYDPWSDDAASDEPQDECLHAVGEDSDGDGLDDAVEDADRDCEASAGETDWLSPDTDGDGLEDGEEDLNANGVWDEDLGEFDPRSADTDRDGVADGDEAAALVCLRTIGDAVPQRVRAGSGEAVLPPGAALAGSTSEVSARLTLEGGGVAILAADPTLLALASPAPPVGEGWRLVAASAGAGSMRILLRGDVGSGVSEQDALSALEAWLGLATDRDPGSDEADGDGEAGMLVGGVFAALESRSGGQQTRWAAALVPAERGAEGAVRAADAGAVAPGPEMRIRRACATFDAGDRATSAPASVLVADTSAGERVGLLQSADAVFRGQTAGGATPALMILPGDSHLIAAAGVPLPPGPLGSRAQVEEALNHSATGLADQRLWYNLRAWVDRRDAPMAAVVVGRREDTEFRLGTSNGFEGHPYAEPLDEGEARAALVQFYGETLGAAGVQLVAIRAGSSCDDEAASLAEVAGAASGAFFDGCAGGLSSDDWTAAVADVTSRWAAIEVSRPVVPGTVELAGAVPRSAWDEGDVVGRPIGPTVDGAAAYMYWSASD